MVVAGGCTQQADGNPNPTDDPGDTAGAEGHPEVPAVEEPLDVDPFVNRPCDLIVEDVLVKVDMDPADPDSDPDNSIGPTCVWLGDRSDAKPTDQMGLLIGIPLLIREDGDGLAGTYRAYEAGQLAYLEMVEVPGHPEYQAAFSAGDDRRAQGHYPLEVAVADDLALEIQYTNETDPGNAEENALKVAAAVLDALKRGE
jgi:hypothetical protein